VDTAPQTYPKHFAQHVALPAALPRAVHLPGDLFLRRELRVLRRLLLACGALVILLFGSDPVVCGHGMGYSGRVAGAGRKLADDGEEARSSRVSVLDGDVFVPGVLEVCAQPCEIGGELKAVQRFMAHDGILSRMRSA
jgi:hypothetical protein